MSQVLRYPCAQCGAKLEFAPGTTSLVCPYCGHAQTIESSPQDEIQELDFNAYLDKARLNTELETDAAVHCNSCGAEFTLPANQEAGRCPFCGSDVVVPAKPEVRIVPGSLLPFQIKEKQAKELYQKWVTSRFWAPNDLKRLALRHHAIEGVYIPFWTYDAQTITRYTGMRGEDYLDTEYYTDANGNRQSRTVTKTRWYPAAGVVQVPFDDVLVLASTHLPPKYADAMDSWKLGGLVPYKADFLSGFRAMRYDTDLASGWQTATNKMQPTIDMAIRADIGGDRQQISSKSTQYHDVTFKHVLLPIWSGAYRYRGRSWNFLVNGQTGEVRGEAPVSFWKVALAVLFALLVIGGFFFMVSQGSANVDTSSSGMDVIDSLPR
jgi:DNA-directed RNA polymerase subunit RPC12/RpoP